MASHGGYPRATNYAHSRLPNQSAVANGLSALRSHVAVIRERIVRSTAATEAVAELGR